MLENRRLNGSIDQIELGFVEREAIPEFLMKLSIQLYLSGLSLSNTVRVLGVFGVQRDRSTVHNGFISRSTAGNWEESGSRCG